MTDNAAAAPPTSPQPQVRHAVAAFFASDNLLARAMVLGLLTLVLLIPLRMIGGVIADRHSFEAEAAKSVSEAWGGPQIFAGPMIVIPYRRASEPREAPWLLTLLPEKLTIDGRIVPEQRRRGLFAVNVYSATLDVVAEFQTAELRALAADGRRIDWSAARLDVGLSDIRSIEGATVEVDGQRIDWGPGSGSALSALKANLGAQALEGRETVSVRFSLTLAGSGKLGSRRSAAAPRRRCRRPGRRPASPAAAREPDRRQGRLSRPLVGLASRPVVWPALGQRRPAQRAVGHDRARVGLRRHPADAGRRLSRDRSGDQVRHHVHRPHLRGLPAVRDGDRHAPACRPVRPDRPRALRLLPAAAVGRRAGRLRARLSSPARRPSSPRPRCTTGRCGAAPVPPSPSAPSSPASMPDCTACCSSRTSPC